MYIVMSAAMLLYGVCSPMYWSIVSSDTTMGTSMYVLCFNWGKVEHQLYEECD